MMSSMQDDALISAQFLTSDYIALTSAQVSRAVELAHHASTEAEQWQTYLTSLALLGLQDWLAQRSPDLRLESDCLQIEELRLRPTAAGSLSQPVTLGQQVTFSQQVSQVRIAASRIHLLTTDCLSDPLVTAAKPSPGAQPDFYLLVEVLEELSEVRVRGYLPQSRFRAQLAAALNLPSGNQTDANQVFLPIQAFNPDPAGLLLHLRAQQAQQQPALSLAVQPTLINLSLWLQDRLDQAAEALSWRLLPPAALNLSGALMGGSMRQSGDLNAVIRALQETQSIEIPTAARAGERDLELEEIRLKLYVLTWVPAPEQWSLLLILGAPPGYGLPAGLTLKVEADQELLAEERLTDYPYLYSLVVGAPHEQFRVTVTSPSGAALTLTPFGFEPDEAADANSIRNLMDNTIGDVSYHKNGNRINNGINNITNDSNGGL